MRVLQGETRGQQVVLVKIQNRPVQQFEAARIDEHLRAVGALEHLIVVFRRRVPRKRIAEARTAAGLDGDAKTAAGLGLLGQLLVDHARCALSDFDHLFLTRNS